MRWLGAQQQDVLPNVVITSKHFDHDIHSPAVACRVRYPRDVRRLLASVRTDLNVFDRDEIEILENFGYTEAVHQLRHTPHRVPTPNADAAVMMPWPEWMDVDHAIRTLRDTPNGFQWKKTLRAVPPALWHLVKRTFRG